jgi:hypothetical protein
MEQASEQVVVERRKFSAGRSRGRQSRLPELGSQWRWQAKFARGTQRVEARLIEPVPVAGMDQRRGENGQVRIGKIGDRALDMPPVGGRNGGRAAHQIDLPPSTVMVEPNM